MKSRCLMLSIALLLLLTPSVPACPFCSAQGKTLLGEVTQAHMILFGTMTNAKRDPDSFDKGSTDLQIEVVVKDHAVLAGRKTLTLDRYIPPDAKTKFLVFCEVFNGKIDPYRGMPVAFNSTIGEYLKGAIDIKDKAPATRLNFFFKYLDATDFDVSNDALIEFANSDYEAFRAVAKTLPADKIATWLNDPETPPSRFGLYGSMLGHSGKPEHAEILRKLLVDPKKKFLSGMDGVLAGYTMLQPKEGWQFICDVIKDQKREFLYRYAAVRAARFFYEFRPDVVSKDDVVKGLLPMLAQPDMADFPIDDFRKWGRFDLSETIVPMYQLGTHQTSIVKRAIIRYALSCPTTDLRAMSFLEDVRADNAEHVRDVEELLWLEQTPVPTPTKK